MRTYIVIGVAVFLAGCAHQTIVYNRPHTTAAQYNQDMGQCKLLAMTIPQDRPYYLPAASGGAAAASGDNATASADASNPVAINAGIAIGTAIQNHNREQGAQEACMQAKGYRAQKR